VIWIDTYQLIGLTKVQNRAAVIIPPRCLLLPHILPLSVKHLPLSCSLGEAGGAGAEPPQNLPAAAAVVQTVLPLK